MREVRYIAPWDVLRDRHQRDKLDDWMAAARDSGSRVVLGFQHSLRSDRLARTLPSAWQFERAFRRVRARYPDVRDWIVWNEANHPFSLTGNRPRRAAQYFDAVAWNCPGCRIVAADVLDVSGMTVVGAPLPAPRRAPAADLGAAQLRRRQPLHLDRHARAAAPRRRGACGSPRRAGWCCGASTPGRR